MSTVRAPAPLRLDTSSVDENPFLVTVRAAVVVALTWSPFVTFVQLNEYT
jgi:hypothetical protein